MPRLESTRVARRWKAMVVLALFAGCATLQRNPVPDNVVESRQMSLRGIDAVQRGEWAQAEVLFSQAIQACPTDQVAHQRYSESLWRRGMHEGALRHMETALELSGGGPAAVRIRLGEMYLARGAVTAAGQEAERALRSEPSAAAAWALLGDVRRQQGQPEDAMRQYHRAVDLQPHYPQVQIALCELYLEQRRARRALATIDSLAESYPPGSAPDRVLGIRGVALKMLGRYTAAIEVLTQVTQREDASAELIYELAEAHWYAGNTASAQVAVQSALALSPHDRRAHLLREQIQLAATPSTSARHQ